MVQDLDDSEASHDFIDSFRASETFYVTLAIEPAAGRCDSRQPGAGDVDHSRAFWPGFGTRVHGEVQMLVDGTDSNTAKLVQGYAGRSFGRM